MKQADPCPLLDSCRDALVPPLPVALSSQTELRRGSNMHPLQILRRLGAALALLTMGMQLAAADANFDGLVDEFVLDSLALSPANATQVGYHSHHGQSLDDELDDFSAAGLAAQRQLLSRTEQHLAALKASALDAEDRTDERIMRDALGASRLELDEIQSFRHNPTVYVELVGNALYTHYTLHYAPDAERFRHIIARLKKIPTLVQQAESNLVDAPQVWNQVAREENDGNIDLIDSELRRACPAALRSAYDAAATPALTALKSLNSWLQQTLAQRPGDWRLGKELYAKKFRYTLETDSTPEQLLAAAEADLAKTRADLAKLSAPATVEQALAAVASHHATPATYMDSAKRELASATAFVRQKDLVTLPSNANLQVIETPVFMRGVYGVGGFNGAPALEPQLGAFFWITPIPASWPQARIDSKLREYNTSGIAHLTVHEAMPGHYVQGEYANQVRPRSRRLLRAIYGNGPYVEGWAVYTQKLMADEGYESSTPGYRLTLDKQMLRLEANLILDVRLQTMGMTDQQALDLMTQQTYQETEEATAKLQRAKLTSCQLPTYYAGLEGWLAARDHYAGRFPGRSQKQFREAALREGAVPLPELDKLLN
jgi:uncharacterized protein (DUF885 family)